MGTSARREKELVFETVYSRYADTLYRLAYSLLLSKEDAEDAVHEVFMKYLHIKQHFQDSEHEKAWLIRVTVNQCHDAARRRKIRTHSPLEEAVDFCMETGAGEVMENILLLKGKYKEVILLHYFEGYSVGEISGILKISQSAAKMRLLRAREMLKSYIQEGEQRDD